LLISLKRPAPTTLGSKEFKRSGDNLFGLSLKVNALQMTLDLMLAIIIREPGGLLRLTHVVKNLLNTLEEVPSKSLGIIIMVLYPKLFLVM